MARHGGFIGRERDLADLDAVLAAAADGSGRLVLVAGEAGIGKTRLADEVCDHARLLGFRVAWAACVEAAVSAAFSPWVQALHGLGARGQPLAPSLRRLLVTDEWAAGPEASSEQDPEVARAVLFSAVASHIASVAGDGPLLLVVDDLHWVDPPSARLLVHVAPVVRTLPVVVVATYRDTEIGANVPLGGLLPDLSRQALVLRLGGLTATQVGELVTAVTGRTVDRHAVEALHGHTDGNPLFARELARLLDEQGTLNEFGRRGAVPMPDGVRGVVRRSIASLSEATGRVLEVAAVAGIEFRIDVVEQVCGLSRGEMLRQLGAAVASRLLVEAGVGHYAFRHALLRAAVYDDLGVPRRVRLHGDVATALERLRNRGAALAPADVAYHFLKAAPGGRAAPAVRYAVEAGDDAMAKLAYEDAVALYRQALAALDLAPDAADRGDLLLRLGEACIATGDLPASREAHREVAALARAAQRPDQLARAALGLGTGPGGFEVALFEREQVTLLEEALDALPAEPTVLRAWVLARLSVALTYEAALERRCDLAESAVATAREVGHGPALGYALAAHCDAIAGPDDCEGRIAAATEILGLAQQFRDPGMELLARRLRLVAHLETGDVGAADAEIEAYARTADRLRQPLYSWYVPMWRGMRALMDGRFEEAEQYRAEATAIGRLAHSPNAAVLTGVQEWVALRRQGRFDAANGCFEKMIRGFGATLPAAPIGRALGLADLGQLDSARIVLDHVIGVLDTSPKDAEWLPMLAEYTETVVRLGGHPLAERLYEMLRPYRHRCIVNGIGAAWYGPVERYLEQLADAMGGGTAPQPTTRNVFRHEGEYWTVAYSGAVARLKDSKGLRDLARLLAASGRAIHVLDLAATPDTQPLREGDLGEVLDATARQNYRARLAELEEHIVDAEAMHDAGRAARAREEREFLAAELAGALGLGGRPRRAGDPIERARSTVTRRIHDALGRIERVHPALGEHLRRSVHTGVFCSYEPEQQVMWDLTA